MNIKRHDLAADGTPDIGRSPASLNSCRPGGEAVAASSASRRVWFAPRGRGRQWPCAGRHPQGAGRSARHRMRIW